MPKYLLRSQNTMMSWSKLNQEGGLQTVMDSLGNNMCDYLTVSLLDLFSFLFFFCSIYLSCVSAVTSMSMIDSLTLT